MTRDHYRAELTELRVAVSGCAFEQARDQFLGIESLKAWALAEWGELPRTIHPHFPARPHD